MKLSRPIKPAFPIRRSKSCARCLVDPVNIARVLALRGIVPRTTMAPIYVSHDRPNKYFVSRDTSLAIYFVTVPPVESFSVSARNEGDDTEGTVPRSFLSRERQGCRWEWSAFDRDTFIRLVNPIEWSLKHWMISKTKITFANACFLDVFDGILYRQARVYIFTYN